MRVDAAKVPIPGSMAGALVTAALGNKARDTAPRAA